MNHTATLNELARVELESLSNQGIQPTFDEVIEINALAWAVQQPSHTRLLSRGRPVPCGGKWLWPLTLNAIDWLEYNGFNATISSPAVGYAMCYSRSEGDELNYTGREAEEKVKKWYNSLVATKDEFINALEQVDAQDVFYDLPPDFDNKPMTLGDFSALLSVNCGQGAEFWERRCSVAYARACLATVICQNRADDKPCDQDPRLEAERALGFAIEKIRARCLLEKSAIEAGEAGK